MSENAYRPRIVDAQLQQFLRAFGAVCIEGPKWCGKTSTAREISSSAVYIGDPAQNFVNRQLAQLQPAVILDGKTPRLIDEWQEYPPLWDAVRYRVDELGKKGLLLQTTREFCTAVLVVSADFACALCHFGNPVIPMVRSHLKPCAKDKLNLP